MWRASTRGGPYTRLNIPQTAVVTELKVSAYPDSTAVSGTPYYYVVAGVDSQGNESTASNEVFAKPLGLIGDVNGDRRVGAQDLRIVAFSLNVNLTSTLGPTPTTMGRWTSLTWCWWR